MNLRFLNNQSGFSLLEMLIAIAVLVFMSFGIYQTTAQTFRLRDVLMNEGDFYNGIRLSMEVVERDIQMIYSPTLSVPPKAKQPPGTVAQPASPPDAQDLQAILSSELGQQTQFWAGATDKTGVRASRFIGTDTKMSFISVDHLRIYKDTPESDFAKVSYELRRDEGNAFVQDAQVLVRIENSSAFDNNEQREKQFERVYPLLNGIKKFQYRYYRKDKDRWERSWDSDKEDYKNLYPDIIELSVEVHGPTRLNFEGKYYFRPEVPLRGLATTS